MAGYSAGCSGRLCGGRNTPDKHGGGVFCDSVGRVYQDGAWRDVWPTKRWLYRNGDECTGVTGGWVFPVMQTEKDVFDYKHDGSSTREKRKRSIYLHAIGSEHLNSVSVYTKKPIDFVGYGKLCVLLDYKITNNGYVYLSLFNAKPDGIYPWGGGMVKLGIVGIGSKSETGRIVSCAVPATESAYVNLWGQLWNGNNASSESTFAVEINIKEIWLEP